MSATQREEGQLRVAVLGVGHLGKIHAQIYAENEQAELVAVVDADLERAQGVADALGCAAYRTVEELPDDLDAVSVVVPTTHHAAVATGLLERGVACLVEKPLADSVEAAESILRAAESGGAILAVGHVERFQPGVRRVHELGIQPRFIECHRLAAFQPRGTDVSVVHDLMIHDLDLVLDLVDSPVVDFDAVGGGILTSTEDLASVRLVFENGARANITASRVSLQPMRRFRMFSADSYVSLDFTKNYGVVVRKGEGWDQAREVLAHFDPSQLAAGNDLPDDLLDVTELELQGERRPLQAELASFLHSVASKSAPEVSGQDGYRALELADRIAQAIRDVAW